MRTQDTSRTHPPLGTARALTCAVALALMAGAAGASTVDPFETFEISTGSGDGSLRLTVDRFGRIEDAIFDPVGVLGAQGVVFEGDVRIGDGASATSLDARAGSLGAASMTSSSVVSEFEIGQIGFRLTQTVSDLVIGGVVAGAVLDQTFVLRNLSATNAQAFSLFRYLDGDLAFDGSSENFGGTVGAGDGRMLFETDTAGGAGDASRFIGIGAVGGLGAAGGANRFSVEEYDAGDLALPLGDAVQGDTDGDGFIDEPFDVTLQLRNAFELAARGEEGAVQTFAARTLFGTGAPGAVGRGGTVTADGTSEINPAAAGASGSGSSSVTVDDGLLAAFGLELGDFMGTGAATPTIFLDPTVATGYLYEVTGAGFASVTAPSLAAMPDADGYVLTVGGRSFDLAPGQTVSFADLLPGEAVTSFEIGGIDARLGLGSHDGSGFVAGVSLRDVLRTPVITRSVQSAAAPSSVPLPAGGVLLVAGLAGLAVLRRRRR